MKQSAARAGVPFVLCDSQDPATDRWQPFPAARGPLALAGISRIL